MSAQLPENVIGISSVGAAKQKVMAYTTSILEAASPDLRQIMMQHLQDCYKEQDQFAKLAEKRGWYTAHLPPEGLVQQAMQQASQALS